MKRPDMALLGVRAWSVGRFYIPFILLQGQFAERLPAYLRLPWLVLVIAISIGCLYHLMFDWITIRYHVDENEVAYQAGWPMLVRSHVGWAEVDSVQVDQDLGHRLLGRYKATILVGAEQRESIIIEALRKQEAADLLRWHRSTSGTPKPVVESPPPNEPASKLVYQASWRDHVVIAFTYGQFVLVIPFLIGTYLDLAGRLPLPNESFVIHWLFKHWGGAVAGLVVCGFGYGVGRSYLRYGNYRVDLVKQGYEVRFGVIERSSRRAQLDSVLGVRIDQNPLMRVLRLASLSLVLRNSHGESQTQVVLPVARLAVVEAHVQRICPGPIPEAGRPRPLLPLSVLGVGGLISLILLAHQLWALAGLLLVFVAWLANRWAATLDTDGHRTVFRRGIGVLRRYILEPGGVRRISSWSLGHSAGILRGVILDKYPIGLVAPIVSRQQVERLEQLVLAHPVTRRADSTRRPTPPTQSGLDDPTAAAAD